MGKCISNFYRLLGLVFGILGDHALGGLEVVTYLEAVACLGAFTYQVAFAYLEVVAYLEGVTCLVAITYQKVIPKA